ncbi:hypothetical protein M231_06587 [Tremella mesenterica]|uniref:Uncharacterized protein n=1 Tax=Tremella mesenterica TaxID=5217 RepID=A0A4Q1BF19_TREME|nr:hypothetical protein M231_06587 [Tremella mesenterica]
MSLKDSFRELKEFVAYKALDTYLAVELYNQDGKYVFRTNGLQLLCSNFFPADSFEDELRHLAESQQVLQELSNPSQSQIETMNLNLEKIINTAYSGANETFS